MTTAGGLYVSMGGRDQEMTFGIGKIDYTDLYDTERRNSKLLLLLVLPTGDGPNKGAKFNLAHLPSDAVTAKDYGKMAANAAIELVVDKTDDMEANKTYVITANCYYR